MDIVRNMQEKSSSLPSSSESSSYSCGSDKRIFLVDDESDQTLSFKIGLENSGFKVDAFNDPIEALSNFKTGTYDLLLLDVRMPKMNGFQLYEELEKIDDKAKVCFITAFEVYYRSLREVFPDIKIDCFIKKPIDTEELVKKVRYELQ
jgi:two-component system, OmpR family, response regulator ChvI